MSDVRVEEAFVADAELVEALRRLVPQLSKTAKPIEAYDVESIVASPATSLLVASTEEHGIVGMLTLALFRVPTGVRGWIEDVVVDEAARGKGVAVALLDEAIEMGRRASARTIDLTSSPTREAANRLYVRYGFTERVTNVYRFSLEG